MSPSQKDRNAFAPLSITFDCLEVVEGYDACTESHIVPLSRLKHRMAVAVPLPLVDYDVEVSWNSAPLVKQGALWVLLCRLPDHSRLQGNRFNNRTIYPTFTIYLDLHGSSMRSYAQRVPMATGIISADEVTIPHIARQAARRYDLADHSFDASSPRSASWSSSRLSSISACEFV
jgi:hypothetical protein